MTTTANQFLYYCDGVLVDDHTLVIPSGFLEHPDAASSRILFMLGNEWMSDDFEDDILISVTYENGICYLLGRNGVIATLGKSGAVLSPENIAGTLNIQILHDAQKRGNMERIRAIGGGVYACGWGGQVYKQGLSGWAHMEDGIENADRHAFVDICGQKEDDIYLCGMHGVMYHFGGKRWTRIDSPTSSHIYSCLYVSEDEIYIGGSSGSLFVGGKNGWHFIGHENMVENIWCIEAFNGNIYAAYSKCIKRFDGDTLEVVDMNFEEQPSVHRLTATERKLMSIGEYDLVEYDAKEWRYIRCPENEQ